MSLLNHRLISRRYFFPITHPLPDPWIVSVPGARLACSKHIIDPSAPTVLHFHGNGEVVADYLPWMPTQLADLGVNLVLAEYRGYGGSTGAPRLEEMLEDGPAIFDALGIPPEKVVVFGRSVGSIYAMHLAAARPGLAGLIIESGIADVLERLLVRVTPEELGVPFARLADAVGAHLNPRIWLARHHGPSLFLHARHDHLVSVDHARRLHGWAHDPKSLMVFDSGDHNSIFSANRSAYLRALGVFLGAI
ncbi:MAG: fermentation-respiration switch protein FrsA (DUF1100 family) [Myxococcota bacterium]|jgi:fermentation-respiration switch protein FrsA (DUF1100 family)